MWWDFSHFSALQASGSACGEAGAGDELAEPRACDRLAHVGVWRPGFRPAAAVLTSCTRVLPAYATAEDRVTAGSLSRFPLDKLKIDRSFVAALGRSSNGGVIIQAIVALGRALGLSVLVEGVETEHQRVLLRLAGCDEMQGFLFARPAPAKAIDKLIAQANLGCGGRGADSVTFRL
jgi:hypothetical protein